jgi:hypothetical protein
MKTLGFERERSRLLIPEQLLPKLRIMRAKKKRSRMAMGRVQDQKRRKKLKIMGHSILMNNRKRIINRNLQHSMKVRTLREGLREKLRNQERNMDQIYRRNQI